MSSLPLKYAVCSVRPQGGAMALLVDKDTNKVANFDFRLGEIHCYIPFYCSLNVLNNNHSIENFRRTIKGGILFKVPL